MSTTYYSPTSYVTADGTSVQRIHGPEASGRAPWLISMPSMKMLNTWGFGLNSLQSRAVIDDFGDLVAVEAWR